jgi:hypothetical protein
MAGFGDLDFMQRGRRLVVGVAMLVLGGVVGYALPKSDASPNSESGQVVSVGDATKAAGMWFTFKPAGSGQNQRFRLQVPTPWKAKPSDPWRFTGLPPCMVPGSTMPTTATLGLITASVVGSGRDHQMVVSVECFS